MSRRFLPGWPMTLLLIAMLPLLVFLGLWQLDRAAEKRGYQTRYFDRLGELPVAPPARFVDAGFLRLRLTGHYQPRHYLVDNHTHQGQPGYWVVTRFAAEDGRLFLINRGWLAAPPSRDRLPEVPTPSAAVTLRAVVWPDLGLVPLLADDPWPDTWPKRVQRLDVARMAADGVDDESPAPVELRLEPGEPGAFRAAPVDADFQPERHVGYAAQWFGLAAVLVVGYLIYGVRQARGDR